MIFPTMKTQIANRLGIAHVRDTLAQFVSGSISREQAAESLQISQSRLYELRTSFLAAKSSGHADEWIPGVSGGNHMPEWPDEVQRFLRKVLHPYSGAKRYSYSFAACEVGRKFNLSIDRGQVRHWAIDHGLQADIVKPRPPAHVRRWQRKSIGELWQLDATPDRFVGRNGPVLQLLDMMDDCSRMQVGCSLFLHEHVPSYLSLFHKAFTKYGLPLEIYVDKARFFRNDDGSLTQLGKRLKFYDISFLFANSPEAKGKIERVHVVWQDRLPAYFEQEGIGMGSSFEELNNHVERLVEYRNNFEEHREIHMTPRKAWDSAIAEGRNKLRAIPDDGWWELVWSEWSRTMVGPRGRVLHENQLFPTECANGTKVWLCSHVDGTYSVVLNKPDHGVRPTILFTNNPRVRRS